MVYAKPIFSWLLLMGIICIGGIASPVNLTPTPQNSRVSTVQALPFALRMNGFTPDEISRPAGNFLISVTNLTPLPEFVITLDRKNGERLHSVKVPKEKRSSRQHVRLPPGTYLLSVMDHPEWVSEITITAP